MRAQFEIKGKTYQIDLDFGIDISMAVSHQGVTAWYIPPAAITPIQLDDFTGSIAEGASTNFNRIKFSPHSHGTHTETLWHVSRHERYVHQCLHRNFFVAQLFSFKPEILGNDRVITLDLFKKQLGDLPVPEAVIIRTLPVDEHNKERDFSNTNPPYLEPKLADFLAKNKVEQLLFDQVSVDKEKDGGALAAHKAFWQLPEQPRKNACITELIFVEESILDGAYMLQIQAPAIINDAAPSRVTIFEILDIK
ncbi:MAG: cyclase family protein [Flavobacteriaceae bacterium]|nr:cyclase family protein [Flavobacteriaceae bacterium]